MNPHGLTNRFNLEKTNTHRTESLEETQPYTLASWQCRLLHGVFVGNLPITNSDLRSTPTDTQDPSRAPPWVSPVISPAIPSPIYDNMRVNAVHRMTLQGCTCFNIVCGSPGLPCLWLVLQSIRCQLATIQTKHQTHLDGDLRISQ